MYPLVLGEWSPTAEGTAFRRLHTLNVAINQARESGADWQSLVPYYRQALAEYRRSGSTDPDYLSRAESFLLSLGTVVEKTGKAVGSAVGSAGRAGLAVLDTGSQRILLAGALVVLGLYFWSRR